MIKNRKTPQTSKRYLRGFCFYASFKLTKALSHLNSSETSGSSGGPGVNTPDWVAALVGLLRLGLVACR